MQARNIKAIDIEAMEWFDKANGNSYFSAQVIVETKNDGCKVLTIPFQYGYSDHYKEAVLQAIKKELNTFKAGDIKTAYLWRVCDKYNIKLTCNKTENCLKREVVALGVA